MNAPLSSTISTCRSCGASGLAPVLDLGSTPLANALLDPAALPAKELTFPLVLVLCPRCSLLQITETVRPDVLFSNYFYRSSFSESFLRHARTIAERMAGERRLGKDSLVVEVASNDGYLLQWYKALGIPVLGIEPATNIARIAEAERGIPTLNEFFGRDIAMRLAGEGRRADVIHANNVLAHVADLNGFVAGFRALLKDDGVVVSESPYARDFLDHTEFDTIYHEHLCYYSLTALDHLFRRHGLLIIDAERLDVHGGSLRIIATPERQGLQRSAAAARLLEEERSQGVADPAAHQGFAQRVSRIRDDLRRLLGDLRRQGRTIAAYGAAAKGATLLNYAAVGSGDLQFVADRSTLKQGRLMPGARLPIVDPLEIMKRKPDYLLILAWNFADEIMRQQQAYHAAGGRYIIPVPEVRIVEPTSR